jgi:actin related protein 2/3 complex subunit 5
LLILNSTRAAEIPGILKGLGGDQQDHLMAYLYKASPELFYMGLDLKGIPPCKWS